MAGLLARARAILTGDTPTTSLDTYAAAAIEFASSPEERDRRAAARQRWAMLNDAWEPLVIASIRADHQPATADAQLGAHGQERADISRNAFARIVEELAVSYDVPALRETKPPEALAAYEALFPPGMLDLFWPEVDRKLNGMNTVILSAGIIDGLLRPRVYDGSNMSVIVGDDPTVADAMVFVDAVVSHGQRVTEYEIYADPRRVGTAWYGVYQRVGDLGPIVRIDDGDGLHGFAGLPGMRLTRYPIEADYWNASPGADLVCATITLGRNATKTNYLRKMQGFKQIAAVGQTINPLPQQLLDPGSIVKFTGEGVDIRILDWQIDFGQLDSSDERLELRAAASRGINPSRYVAADTRTAEGMRRGDDGRNQRRAKMALIYRPGEQAFADLMLEFATLNQMPDVPATFDLTVLHAPTQMAEDPLAQQQLDAQNLTLGVTPITEIVRRKYPDMDEAEALAYVMANIEQWAEVAEVKTKRNVPDDPTKRSASDVANGEQGGRPSLDDSE